MSKVYELVGRVVVSMVWMRYRRELKIAAAAGGTAVVAAAVVAYVLGAGRDVEEG